MARTTPTRSITRPRSIAAVAATLIAAVAVLAVGLVALPAGASHNDPIADELDRLQQVQIAHLKALGVTTDDLAADVRRHLGLPEGGIGSTIWSPGPCMSTIALTRCASSQSRSEHGRWRHL